MDLSEFTIPEGWTIEHVEGYNMEHALITAPKDRVITSMVSVNFERRDYRFGMCFYGKPAGPNGLKMGRGWKQRLVDAAVKALKETWE